MIGQDTAFGKLGNELQGYVAFFEERLRRQRKTLLDFQFAIIPSRQVPPASPCLWRNGEEAPCRRQARSVGYEPTAPTMQPA